KRKRAHTSSPSDRQTADPAGLGQPIESSRKKQLIERTRAIQWVINNASKCKQHQEDLSLGVATEPELTILRHEACALVEWAKPIPKDHDRWIKAYGNYKQYESRTGSKDKSESIDRMIHLQTIAVEIAEAALDKVEKADWH